MEKFVASVDVDVLSTQSACTVLKVFFLFCSAMIGKEDLIWKSVLPFQRKFRKKIDEHSQPFYRSTIESDCTSSWHFDFVLHQDCHFKRRELRNLCRSDEIFASLMLCRWRVLSTFSSERGVRRRFKLKLISDVPGIKQVVAGDVIEIAYNLYAMYATLNIDVALLLNVDQSVLQGWWAQVNLIQRDAYIHTAAMLGGKGPSESRFELVCIYVSGLTQLNTTEAISVVKGKESHTATCPVPWCRICGRGVGKQGETSSIGASAQSFWSHSGTCMQNMMYTSVGNKHITPLQIPGDYHPDMDHVELIEAQITREGMLAYESITEAALAGYQEMILFKRREYFDALHMRYSPAVIAKEPGVINFCYPLMHMIATGQLFDPKVFHPTASGEDRRAESEYCLERLAEWIKLFDWKRNPKNVNMNWEGECMDAGYLSKWDRTYTIPDLYPEMRPEYHPTSFHIHPTSVRMILPAKGMLPVGSYIGSPGFGLIHPNTITAAVLQNAGFVREDDDPDNPMKFDAFSLAPNFDIPIGRYRMMALNGMITDWELYESQQEETLVCIPPEDLTPQDLFDFQNVPVKLSYRDHLSPQLHQEAFDIAKKHTEDQLLSCHMAPMLADMGTNLRAMLYQHALSRAGLDTTPLRDMLTKLDSVVDQVIAHSWLNEVDYDQIKQYVGDHPSLAEKYPVRKFRQLLWDVVGCEATLGEWRKFTSEEQRLLLYASFYGVKAPAKVPYQKGFRLDDEDYQLIEPDIEWEYHSQYLTQNSYSIFGEEGEPEPAITPPPPTAPELEDPLLFDPKVTGIWDHLIALMTDEQKSQLKESAKSEQVTPSFRHITSTLREASPSSEGAKSRGPSRRDPLYLGRIAVAAHKARAFVNFQDLKNTILPCSEREAVALFSSPPWIQRITACNTSNEVMEVFALYHQQCWSEEHKNTTDLLMQTERGSTRYKKIRRRLKYMDVYAAQHRHYPTEFEEDDAFSSEDEPLLVSAQPVLPRYRHVVPGDFILIFNVLVLASSLEREFPHRAEYWWTLLPGTLDQACTCLSMQNWVDELKTCETEESFLTTYQRSTAEKEAQDKIDDLMQKLQEARDAKAKAEKEAQKAAEERAQKAGEDLVYEIESEEAAKQRKREASKEKKKKKKKRKKTSPEDEGESELSEGEEDKPEGDKSKEEKRPDKDEPSKDESKEEDKDKEGPIKDEEPAEPWIEVVRRAAKPRQNTSKAAEKARARTYPRPMCEATAQIDYVYAPQHVPTRELFTSGKWSVIEKTKDIPSTRNPMKLKDNPHKAIHEYGIRRRFTDYKVCVLQVLEAGKQTPPQGSPFALDGPETYWVQTTIQLNEDGTLPFAELPGMFPSLYTFDTFGKSLKRLTDCH